MLWDWLRDTYRLREDEKEAGGAEGSQPSAQLPNLLLCVLSRRMGEDGCGKGWVREENKRIGRKEKGGVGCVTRTWHAAVIWSEYKTEERERARLARFSHLHTALSAEMFDRLGTWALQCQYNTMTCPPELARACMCVVLCAWVGGRAKGFHCSMWRCWVKEGMSKADVFFVIEIWPGSLIFSESIVSPRITQSKG